METRQQVAAGPKVAAPLVDTRTVGKSPTFTGEHKEWSEWSFQFTAYMGSANPKSIEAMRWLRCRMASLQPQRSCNRVLRCTMLNGTWPWYCCAKGSAWVTVKNTEVNNGLEAWRGLNATYDSNNKGRQRVRMQLLITAETCRVDSTDD